MAKKKTVAPVIPPATSVTSVPGTSDPAMSPAAQRILHGKIELIQKHPFYASLVLQMEFVETARFPTAATDGKTIFYNPDFIGELTTREVAGLLAHEVMHIALQHHTRRYNREPRRWNYACDYAINPMLLEAGMHLPEGGLLEPEFFGLSAEQIYALLPPPPPGAPVGFGEVLDEPGGEPNRDTAEAEARAQVAQALLDTRMRGSVPESLERLVEQLLQPRVDWRAVLARFVCERCQSDYSWLKPNVRFLYRGIYLPALDSTETGKIILIADTSGSISDDLINQFAGEVSGIAETFHIPLKVIYVDAKVCSVQDIEPGDDIDLQPKGGGGTDFRPGFELIEKDDLQPRAVVYLTDGDCTSYPPEPPYPVLWVQFGHCRFEPPFGEKIQIVQE
jgi:predicted metal-dependent peptidase